MFPRPPLSKIDALKKEAVALLESEVRSHHNFSRLLWGTILLLVIYNYGIPLYNDIRQERYLSPHLIPTISLISIIAYIFNNYANTQPTLGFITHPTLKRITDIIRELNWPDLVASQDINNTLPIYSGGRFEHHLRLRVTDIIQLIKSQTPVGLKITFDDLGGIYTLKEKAPQNHLNVALLK